MEAQEFIDLALNARLNYWPPHLGLKTDAEKIEHLAAQLDKAATGVINAEVLADENETLREEKSFLENEVADLRHKLEQIHSLSLPSGG